MKSGDIETEPGPEKLKPFQLAAILLTTFLLLLLIGISNYNIKTENLPEQNTRPSTRSIVKQSLDSICHLLILRNNKKHKHIKLTTRAAYLIILLLIAGDIQPHPGQNKENNCLICKQPEDNKQALTCETCRGWSHLSCSDERKNVSSLLSNSYEWLCPNPTCLPNYHEANDCNLKQTPNRYKELKKMNQPTKCQKIKQRRNPQKTHIRKNIRNKQRPTSQTVEDTLFNALTKITPEDFIGKERCKACHKTVASHHRCISCDQCQRLTHLRCSDMTVKVYNTHKNKEFPWVCNTCRQPEDIEPTTDIKKLKQSEMPTSNQNLIKLCSDFLILHYNCRSIMNKIEELWNICSKLKPEIICLTETWLDESSSKTAHIPEGYKILRCDRTETFKQKYGKTNGGGTAILYREDIRVRKLKIDKDDQETQWIEVKAKPNFILGVVYRAHYTDLLNETEEEMPLETQLCEASLRTNKLIVTGDFNCDTSALNKEQTTTRLEQMFKRFSMEQLITKPTRISINNNTTIIDHVWTDPTSKLIRESGTIEGISDHVGQYILVNQTCVKQEPDKIRFRSYRNYNKEKFNEDLQQNLGKSDFNNLIEDRELNKAMDTWTKVFVDTAQTHAPIVEKTKKQKRQGIPWFETALELKIEERNSKLQLHRLYGLKQDLKAVNKLSNEITHLKRKLKKKYYKQKIEEYDGDSKKMWKILKHMTQTETDKSNIEPEYMDQDKVNHFNKYFATIGTEIQKKLGIKEITTTTENKGVFQFKEETEENIIKLIDRIRKDVATGADDISAILLKDAKLTVAKSLTKLVNLSYSKSAFPNSMKIAIIKALHKKDCTEDVANYRPLSILSVVSKVFERSATDQLVKYLEDNKILNLTQHAYRKGHSTTTCLMEVIEYIHKQRDSGKIVGLASLDLSKAFDSISHTHLLEKLVKLGLNTHAVLWCKSYLQDRKQRTKFTKYISDEHKVTSGVPQGSILGPILFICFTNDMTNIFQECKIISYADDTQIMVSGNSKNQVKTKLEHLIKIAQGWYTENSLMNNASKTEILIIGKKNAKEETKLKIEVTEFGKVKFLEPKKYIKILGVYIDDQLNWNQQIQNLRKKTTNSIRNLHRVQQLIPLKHRILLYDSLVASHYNYADIVWSGCGKTNEKKLQTTHNFAARSILGRRKRSSATDALKTLKFLPLKDKRKVHEAVYVHKALQGKLPSEITTHYTEQLSKHNLRSSTRRTLNLPAHRTQQYQNGPMYRTVKSWNSTPTELRKEITTNTFKKKFQTHLLDQEAH